MTQLVVERTLPVTDTSSSAPDVVAVPHLRSLSAGRALSVALIDSRALTREGLIRLLEGFERLSLIPVAHSAELLGKGPNLVSQVEIVLFNIGSAAIHDPQVLKDLALLNETLPEASIIIICDRDDSQQVGEALRHGIRGYIPTTLTSQILMGALRLVQAGGTFVPAGALTHALSHQPTTSGVVKVDAAGPDLCGLTPRQREVLELLRQGKPNKIIAHELAMRESTVKVHVRQIMRKMRVTNRTEAAFLASHGSLPKRT